MSTSMTENDVARLVAELSLWQRYAAYCLYCARNGEPDPDSFEVFKVNHTRQGQMPTPAGSAVANV